jgi:hypothetical protein
MLKAAKNAAPRDTVEIQTQRVGMQFFPSNSYARTGSIESDRTTAHLF